MKNGETNKMEAWFYSFHSHCLILIFAVTSLYREEDKTGNFQFYVLSWWNTKEKDNEKKKKQVTLKFSCFQTILF